MAFMTLNGAPVISGVLTLPRTGLWAADLIVATPTPPSGGVLLTLAGSMVFAGTVYRAGAARGASTVRLLGGAGGLSVVLGPKGYRGVTLQLPLKEILAGAGETLSAAADALVLGTNLVAWSRLQTTAGSALAALMQAVPGAAWRAGADGALWVGIERWPATGLGRYVLTKDDPHHGRQEIAANVPNLYPGESFNGRHVSCVEHRVDPRSVRATVYYEG